MVTESCSRRSVCPKLALSERSCVLADILSKLIKGKTCSFYIAQYPVCWTAQSASHFLLSLTDLFIPTSFSASPGSILARQQLRAKSKSLTFPPLYVASWYSFIQLSQQGRQWRERKCTIFETSLYQIKTKAAYWNSAYVVYVENNFCSLLV